MKFNLKNFPIKKEDIEKWGDIGVPDLSGTIFKSVSKWVLGFEKELRDIQKNNTLEWKGKTRYLDVVKISEILGEDSS